MATALITLFSLLILCGILLVPFGLPGTWLIAVAAFFYSLFRDYQGGNDQKVVIFLVLLGLLGEVVEFLIGFLGAKKQNVPNGAIWASFIGGLLGAIVGVPVFLIGSILGMFLGTFLGAYLYAIFTQHDPARSFQIALATLSSRVISIFVKTTIALVMGIYWGMKVF